MMKKEYSSSNRHSLLPETVCTATLALMGMESVAQAKKDFVPVSPLLFRKTAKRYFCFSDKTKEIAIEHFCTLTQGLILILLLPLFSQDLTAKEFRTGAAVYESETGKLSLGKLSATIPSDSVECHSDGSLLLRGSLKKLQSLPAGISGDLLVWSDPQSRWLNLRWIFRSASDGAVIEKLNMPDFEYNDTSSVFQNNNKTNQNTCRLEAMKALGTAGLTSVDGHLGSYMFLACARPYSRKGVVAGWKTTDRASGIVFSSQKKISTTDLNAIKSHTEKSSEHKTLSSKNDERIIKVVPEAEVRSGKTSSVTCYLTVISAREEFGRLMVGRQEEFGEIFMIAPFGDIRDGLESYADAVAAHYQIKMKKPPIGFCTWYSDKNGGAGDQISTPVFARTAAEKLVPWGVNLFQIDSRWQSGHNKNPEAGEAKNFTAPHPAGPYSKGMKPIADCLNQNGLIGGLWILPFAGSTSDSFFDNKRDLFVRSAEDFINAPENDRGVRRLNQKKNEPYNSYWGGTCFDLTNPKTLEFIHAEVRQITEKWGFNYLKIDGLWTGLACQILYVNDGYRPDDLGKQIFADPKATNVSAFRKGAQAVRSAAGNDVFILGSVASQNMRSLGASYGFVDAMRIGPDNGTRWGFNAGQICAGPVRGTPRYFYNGRVWWNDPDPVYVRNSIPIEHAKAIASWTAITGQLYLFADWLPDLAEDRLNILRRTIPHHNRISVRPIDLLENSPANAWILSDPPTAQTPRRDTIAFFNWQEKEKLQVSYSLDYAGLENGKTYSAWDFWNDRLIDDFHQTLLLEVPPASCRVLSVRESLHHPFLISTNRHVAGPLFDIKSENWNALSQTLSGTSRIVWKDRYELRIVVPEAFANSDPQAEISITEQEEKKVALKEKKSNTNREKKKKPLPAINGTVRDLSIKKEGRILRISFIPIPTTNDSFDPIPISSVSDTANEDRFNVSIFWQIKFKNGK